MKYYILTAAFLIFLSILLGCGSVPIKDEIFYGTKGSQGAIVVHTLTPGTILLSEADWLNIFYNQPLVCSSAQTFGDIKAAVEKLCSVCNCCSYETKAAVETFFSNVQKAQEN